MKCTICGKGDKGRPMAFRGENQCSELHRKAAAGELRLEVLEKVMAGVSTKNEKSVVE